MAGNSQQFNSRSSGFCVQVNSATENTKLNQIAENIQMLENKVSELTTEMKQNKLMW